MGNVVNTDYITDINIQEAVVHILDSNGDEPILNEYKLELTEDVYLFIYKHAEKLLKSEDLKYAKFNIGRNIVQEVCQDYLNGIDNDFIKLSKDLARQLFLIMKGNSNIPSCDLMVISLITDQGPIIGVLKMDYIKNFTHKVEFLENKIGIGIVPQTAGLPSSGQRIEKAAFIKPIRKGQDFDLMIIDKTKNNEDDEYGAKYFLNTFLDCVLVEDRRSVTKTLLQATEKWTRSNITDDAAKAEMIRSTIKNKVLEEGNIDIEELAEELFQDSPSTMNEFATFVKGHGLEDEITVDKMYAEKKLQKVKLKVDKDIDITISLDAYKDSSKFEIIKNNDGSINMVIKNIVNYIEK